MNSMIISLKCNQENEWQWKCEIRNIVSSTGRGDKLSSVAQFNKVIIQLHKHIFNYVFSHFMENNFSWPAFVIEIIKYSVVIFIVL